VLLLIDDSGDEARLRFAEARYGFRYVGYDQTLEELLKGSDPWLRSCALYVAGTRREPAFLPLVESSLASLDPHVRETAAWARLALAKA
jgi:HEAT repeat protein